MTGRSGRSAPGSSPAPASATSPWAWRARATTFNSHAVRREGLARDLLHDRDGALTGERDWHRVGAHAVVRDAAGGVEGAEEGGDELNLPRPRIGGGEPAAA